MSFIAGGFVAAIIQRITQLHPRFAVQVIETTTSMAAPEFRELRDRKVDLVLGRISTPIVADDLNVEPLFDQSIVVVTSAQSEWANRVESDLADLSNAPWMLAPHPNMARELVGHTFRSRGLKPPRPKVTPSMQLRLQLLTNGRYVTVFTASTVRYSADRWLLKVLPIELGPRLPVVSVTLKHRTLSPAAELFIHEVPSNKNYHLSIELVAGGVSYWHYSDPFGIALSRANSVCC
jgi:DNA-binding transcriptional LysR family regulator